MAFKALKPAPGEGRAVAGRFFSVFSCIPSRMVKPGVRVSVEYSQERGKPPVSASIVRVYEEGARR